MKKIGITGSIASGKSTASKILSIKRGPLFSADFVVKKLYAQKKFKNLISRKFKLKSKTNFKKILKLKIQENKDNVIKLEKIIHPLVRKEMKNFIKINNNKPFCFFEIPLLIESKLMKYFDVIILIKANKKIRSKRFQLKGGSEKLFQILNNKQLNDSKKMKYCDHVVVNEKNINVLKKNLLDIFKLYA